MKKVLLNSNESCFRLVKNVGVFILVIGVFILIVAGLIGLSLIVEDDISGVALLGGAVLFFMITYFAFGVCRGLSELVMNSYLQRKISEAKAESDGIEIDELHVIDR